MAKSEAITVRISEETYSEIKKKQKDSESNAEVCRRLIKDSLLKSEEIEKVQDEKEQLQNEIKKLQSEIEEKQNRINRLQKKLEETNQRITASNDIVEYVEEEKRIKRKNEIREDMKNTANIFKRMKWKIIGMPNIEEFDGSTQDKN